MSSSLGGIANEFGLPNYVLSQKHTSEVKKGLTIMFILQAALAPWLVEYDKVRNILYLDWWVVLSDALWNKNFSGPKLT